MMEKNDDPIEMTTHDIVDAELLTGRYVAFVSDVNTGRSGGDLESMTLYFYATEKEMRAAISEIFECGRRAMAFFVEDADDVCVDATHIRLRRI